MVDPIEITSEFFEYSPKNPKWPFMTLFDDYWGGKVRALAKRCAKAENKVKKLKNQLRDQKKMLKCYDTTPGSIDMATQHIITAVNLLGDKNASQKDYS